jgi:polar amino acid transport system substrate-binding protein
MHFKHKEEEMKHSRKFLSLLMALTLSLSLGLFGCEKKDDEKVEEGASNPLGLIEEGKLIIGSDCDYPPFISLDENGEPTGFEVELMQAIADDLGLELVYIEPLNFDSLPTVVAGGGKIDLAVSSITITDDRKEVMDFCIPYFVSNQAVVVRAGSSYTTALDLDGLVVGAQSGTTGLDWAVESLPNATVKEFNQTSEGLAALRAGEIEAMIFDEPVAIEHVKSGYDDCEVLEVIPTAELYAFGVSYDNPELKAAINESLQKLIDDGTYAEIFAKYFDIEPEIK